MKTYLPILVRAAGAAIIVSVSVACTGVASESPAAKAPAGQSSTTPAPVAASSPASGSLMQQIQAEVGDAACDSARQCHTIAIGNKACGGPESYMAWSDKRSNGATLTRLAEQYAAERKGMNVSSGRISTCSMVMDPGATCTSGRCVTGGDPGPLQTR